MNSNKKGQIQSGETVTVVIILIILIVLGIVYASNSKIAGLQKDNEKQKEIDGMKIAVLAAGMDELKCSVYSAKVSTCLDIYRLSAFSQIVSQNLYSSKEYYFNTFRNSKIEVNIIVNDTYVENIVLYDFNNSENKSSSPIFFPLTVSDPVSKINYFSIMEVRTYN